jgi:hypothetical protein
MPALSFAEKAVAPEQVSEVESLPMQITHAQMIEQSLRRSPGIGNKAGIPTMEYPAARELPIPEGSISRAELVRQSLEPLPGTGGTTVAAKVNPRVAPKYESR